MTEETAWTVPPALQPTSAIVAAYLRGNRIPVIEVPAMIRSVHGAMAGLSSPSTVEVTSLKPAVPIKKSVMPDYIVCLEDGKRLKMLKRYIRSRFKLTPDEYRSKWNLPHDYPMVAPNYAERRSQLAKKIGLGTTPNKKGRTKLSAAVVVRCFVDSTDTHGARNSHASMLTRHCPFQLRIARFAVDIRPLAC
jgi:predicted transcriptional regulator